MPSRCRNEQAESRSIPTCLQSMDAASLDGIIKFAERCSAESPDEAGANRLLKNPFQQPVSAVQGCTARESITQVIDSSETSPGMYRTRRAEEVQDGLFQHPAKPTPCCSTICCHTCCPRDSRTRHAARSPAGRSQMPRVQTPDCGASQLFDVSPGDEAHGLFMMPGGQSSYPLSARYGAGHEDWNKGKPTPILQGPARRVLHLLPAR